MIFADTVRFPSFLMIFADTVRFSKKIQWADRAHTLRKCSPNQVNKTLEYGPDRRAERFSKITKIFFLRSDVKLAIFCCSLKRMGQKSLTAQNGGGSFLNQIRPKNQKIGVEEKNTKIYKSKISVRTNHSVYTLPILQEKNSKN